MNKQDEAKSKRRFSLKKMAIIYLALAFIIPVMAKYPIELIPLFLIFVFLKAIMNDWDYVPVVVFIMAFIYVCFLSLGRAI